MRGSVACWFAIMLCAATPVRADLKFVDIQAHPSSAKPSLQVAFMASHVVLLGRVLAPMAPVDTLGDTLRIGGKLEHLSGPLFAQRLRIEPIEYLKGGLEGDLIDVRYLFGGMGPGSAEAIGPLAGVDTLGAIFFLRRVDHDWRLTKVPPFRKNLYSHSEVPELERQLREGLLYLPQRRWTETLDQVRAWIHEMPNDSTLSKP